MTALYFITGKSSLLSNIKVSAANTDDGKITKDTILSVDFDSKLPFKIDDTVKIKINAKKWMSLTYITVPGFVFNLFGKKLQSDEIKYLGDR